MCESVETNKYAREIVALAESSAIDVCSPLASITHGTVLADRDFATFEFSFYYFFVHDYKVFHKLPPRLRTAIADDFLKQVFSPRRGNFRELKTIDGFFDNRMQAYFEFMKEAKQIGAFVSRAADYINILVTRAITDGGYAYGRLSDLSEIRKGIESDRHTDLIKHTLMLNSSLLLGAPETKPVVLRALYAEIADYITGVVSDIAAQKPTNMIELSAFAMFVITEVYTLVKKTVREATPVLDGFHRDMTNFVINEYFLKQHPDAGEEHLWRLYDYFPKLLRIRYPEYRAALRKDLTVCTTWRNTSESLMEHLFTERLTQEEKARVLIPLSLKIAQSYTWAMMSISSK